MSKLRPKVKLGNSVLDSDDFTGFPDFYIKQTTDSYKNRESTKIKVINLKRKKKDSSTELF